MTNEFTRAPDIKAVPRPKYCTRCGLPLENEERRTYFDAYTGEGVYLSYLHCPDQHESWKFTGFKWEQDMAGKFGWHQFKASTQSSITFGMQYEER